MTEKEMVYTALTGWINHVETGNFAGMDKNTILMLARSDKDMRRKANKLPILMPEQQDFIKQLRELAHKITSGESVLKEA